MAQFYRIHDTAKIKGKAVSFGLTVPKEVEEYFGKDIKFKLKVNKKTGEITYKSGCWK